MPVRSPSYYATVAAPNVKQILVGNIWVRIAWVAQRLVASGESDGKVVFFFDVEKKVVKNAAAAAWLAMTLKNCFFCQGLWSLPYIDAVGNCQLSYVVVPDGVPDHFLAGKDN